jgi:hypothetical protein
LFGLGAEGVREERDREKQRRGETEMERKREEEGLATVRHPI